MPPVSIFIPAKDEAAYIGGLLTDLSAQNYAGDLEVVVYDAGSIDDTREIVRRHSVEVREGGPVNIARNKGVRQASHGLVIMLDADVQIASDFVHKAVREFQRRDIDIATAWNVPYVKQPVRADKYLLIQLGWLVAQVYQWLKQFSNTPRLTSTFVILTKSAWEQAGGFDENVYRGGDTDFAIRAVRAGCRFRFLGSVSLEVSARKAVTIGILRYFLVTCRMNRVLAKEKLTRVRYEEVTGDRNYFQNK